MRYLGLDLGTTTLGISVSDRNNQIALPMETLKFPDQEYEKVLPFIEKIITEKGITDFVLGYPKNMNNSEGFASQRSKDFKILLEKSFHLPVHLVDERLTTVEAQKILIDADTSRKKRKKQIDRVAASLILETYLHRKEEEK